MADEIKPGTEIGTDGTGGGNPRLKDEDHDSQDAPMSEAQQAYLKNLAEESGTSMDGNLSRGEADRKIEELKEKGQDQEH